MLVGFGVDPVVEIGDDGRECLFGLFVQVGDGNSGCKDGVIWVFRGEICGCLSSEILPLATAIDLHLHRVQLL